LVIVFREKTGDDAENNTAIASTSSNNNAYDAVIMAQHHSESLYGPKTYHTTIITTDM